jgi:hypothetical protein
VGAFRCNKTADFYTNSMAQRVCSASNFDKKKGKNTNQTVWNWNAGKRAVTNDNKVVEEVGYCTCNRTTLRTIQNVTAESGNLTLGVPDGFVKDGMATFYVQLVIGGRKTSDPEEGCACKGPDDTSDACMCMLGTKKIPYIYNNSFIPYYTALVAIKNGGLIYTNTYIKYNFDANGMGEHVCIRVTVCVCVCMYIWRADIHEYLHQV